MPELGHCDFKQYEHCGPHEQIPSIGQRLPPFGRKNWKADSAISEASSVSQDRSESPAEICAEMARDAAVRAARNASLAREDGDEFALGAAAQLQRAG